MDLFAAFTYNQVIKYNSPVFSGSFFAAMEAKHVVATTQEDGTVQLDTGDKTVTLPSPTLAALYASGEALGAGNQDALASVEGHGLRDGQDLFITQPWRRAAVTAAEALIAQFEQGSDIDLDDCPILDELKSIVTNAATDMDMDAQHAGDILHGGQMFRFICDNEEDL